MPESPQQTLSLIIPVCNESAMLEAFLVALLENLQTLPLETDILFIDDGSTDDSWSKLCRLQAQTPNMTILRFSRNFGKEAAILAGQILVPVVALPARALGFLWSVISRDKEVESCFIVSEDAP